MIYRNDDLKITDEYVIGTIKDLKEYFRYEIASKSMSYNFNYENYSHNVKEIIALLDNLYEDTDNDIYTDDDTLKVSMHPMGSFIIESEWEDEL